MHSGTIRKYGTGSWESHNWNYVFGSPPQWEESWLNLLKKKAEKRRSWLSQVVPLYIWGWENEADPAKSIHES